MRISSSKMGSNEGTVARRKLFRKQKDCFKIKSETSKKCWANSEYRETQTKIRKERWANTEFKERMIQKQKERRKMEKERSM